MPNFWYACKLILFKKNILHEERMKILEFGCIYIVNNMPV